MNVLSLCSGAGGLELGLRLATGDFARTVAYVEREIASAQVQDRVPTGRESRPKLNPLFVEWLMGLPPGWTAFEPLAMPLSRWWRLMRSELSRLEEA